MIGVDTISPMDTVAAAMDRSQGDGMSRQVLLLKKAISAEKDMVEQLLPAPPGRLDVRA
ncbi:MAG: hypothetical protein ACP5VE_05655 [Chthonomonadales bacterium]